MNYGTTLHREQLSTPLPIPSPQKSFYARGRMVSDLFQFNIPQQHFFQTNVRI